MDSEPTEKSGILTALMKYRSAMQALRAQFQSLGNVTLRITLLDRESIQIDVDLEFSGDKGFAYVLEHPAEFHLNVWNDDKKITLSAFANAPKLPHILVSIEPYGKHTFIFNGFFTQGDMGFKRACIFEEVGNHFEIAYEFLGK